MFPVSVWSGYFPEFAFEQIVDTFLSFGFSHTELSTNQVAQLLEQDTPAKIGKQMAQYCQNKGFSVPQGHLSFKGGLCNGVERLKPEIDLFQAMGIRNAVLHFNGGGDLSPEERQEQRLAALGTLCDYVKGTDLIFCLENLGSVPETHTVEQLKSIIETVGSPNLGICLDMGHLHLVNGRGEAVQTQEEFILGAGSLLKALHVTNNSGLGDVHLMPYSSRYGIDYVPVVRSLKKIGYEGLFNLEILGECEAPMPIKLAKLRFIKEMTDYMMSDAFLT